MQNNDFRSATSLKSLKQTRSNNTFATATNLGNIPSNATSVSFRASNSVGSSDNVDFYKFTLSPGVKMSSGREVYRLRDSSITFSRYSELQGKRFFIDSETLQRGSTPYSSNLRNSNQFPITFYLKVERRVGNARYKFKLNFFR
jgi:hypothetical protein